MAHVTKYFNEALDRLTTEVDTTVNAVESSGLGTQMAFAAIGAFKADNDSSKEAIALLEANRIGRTSPYNRLRLHLDSLGRYHGAGALIMTAGSIVMIISSLSGILPLWAGFLVGALPTFLVAMLAYPEHV